MKQGSHAGALIGATLLGLAYEIYEPASQALIAESVEVERRPRAYGLHGAALATIAGQRLLRGAAARPFTLIRAGLVLMAVGFAVIAYAAPLPLLTVGSAIVALCEVLLLGPPIALVAGLAATDGSRASYLAAYGTCWGIAQTVGPLLTTSLMSHAVPTTWLAGAGLCLALATATPLAAVYVAEAR